MYKRASIIGIVLLVCLTLMISACTEPAADPEPSEPHEGFVYTNVVLFEDFNEIPYGEIPEGWITSKMRADRDATWGVENGELIIRSQPTSVAMINFGDEEWTDYEFVVTARVVEGAPDRWWAPVFRVQLPEDDPETTYLPDGSLFLDYTKPNYAYHQVSLRQNGNVIYADRTHNNNWTALLPTTYDGFQMDTPITARVVVKDDRMVFFLDDQLMLESGWCETTQQSSPNLRVLNGRPGIVVDELTLAVEKVTVLM